MLLVLALAVGAAVVHAQAGGYDLSWNTVDTGGATAAGGAGGYTLGGTAGQPDAATWSGGGYTLAGGSWHAVSGGAGPGETAVYLPVIMRQ